MAANKVKVTMRKNRHVEKIATSICYEKPLQENPFLTKRRSLHGYDEEDLIENADIPTMLYLLFRGTIPEKKHKKALSMLLLSSVNPSPRSNPALAGMHVAVSKTVSVNYVPIIANVLGGKWLGAGEVVDAGHFLKKNIQNSPVKTAGKALAKPRPKKGDWHPIPGFGSLYDGIDPIPQKRAEKFAGIMGNEAKAMQWGNALAQEMKPYGMGWLSPGVWAAGMFDLGFDAWEAGNLFTWIGLLGALALTHEKGGKPIAEMPWIDDDHYFIAESAKAGGKK
jgi:citrate synthase